MSANHCIFCDIAAERAPAHIVWANDDVVVFLDHRPITLGHLLVIPRVHVATLWELEEARFLRILTLVRRLATLLPEAIGADRAGMAVEGYGIPHAHVHLVPINRAGELDPRRQSRASEVEMEEAARRIRERIDSELRNSPKN